MLEIYLLLASQSMLEELLRDILNEENVLMSVNTAGANGNYDFKLELISNEKVQVIHGVLLPIHIVMKRNGSEF